MKKIKKLLSIVLTISMVLSHPFYIYADTYNLDNIECVESSELVENKSNIDVLETETLTEISLDDISEERLFDEIEEIAPIENFLEDFEYEDEPEYDIVESENLFIEINVEESLEETIEESIEDTVEIFTNIDNIVEEESEFLIETNKVIEGIVDLGVEETENLTFDLLLELNSIVDEINSDNEINELTNELTFDKSNLLGATDKKISSIKAINSFNKKNYNYGERIDLSGFTIEVLYEDGTKNNVTYSDENKELFKIYTNLVAECDIARDCSYLTIRFDPNKNFIFIDEWSIIDFGSEKAKIEINNIPDFEKNNLPTFKLGIAGSIDNSGDVSKAKWEIGKSVKENLKNAWPVILYSYEETDPNKIKDYAYVYNLYGFDENLNSICYPALHHFCVEDEIVTVKNFGSYSFETYHIYFAIKNLFFDIIASVNENGLTTFKYLILLI